MTRLRLDLLFPEQLAPAPRQQWVMLVDIMGFSARVGLAEERNRLAAIYAGCVYQLQLIAKMSVLTGVPENLSQDEQVDLQHSAWLRHVKIFSDSMFFFYDADGAKAVNEVLINPAHMAVEAALVSRLLWIAGVPNRGALAWGEVYSRDPIFLGMPIVEAYQWEQTQNWMGISVHPTSVDRLSKLIAEHRTDGFENHSVPTKTMGAVPTICLNIFHEEANEYGTQEQVVAGLLAAFRNAKASGNVKALPRYVETVRLWREFGVHDAALEEVEADPTCY